MQKLCNLEMLTVFVRKIKKGGLIIKHSIQVAEYWCFSSVAPISIHVYPDTSNRNICKQQDSLTKRNCSLYQFSVTVNISRIYRLRVHQHENGTTNNTRFVGHILIHVN